MFSAILCLKGYGNILENNSMKTQVLYCSHFGYSFSKF
jgi:hypothetical protein